MDPAEIKLIEVAKRYTAVAIQISRAYETEQAKLQLGDVLSHGRLSSSLGVRESLAAIERLAELTDTHKAAVEKVFLAAATDLTKVMAELPEEKQAEHRDGLLKSFHGHLAAQSQLYETRGAWIAAAREICNLVESRRDTARFVGESIVFAEDADYGRFEALLAGIEETHQAEVAHMQQMLERFSRSAALLGLSPHQ